MIERFHMAEMVDSAIKSFAECTSAKNGYYALRPFLPYLIRKFDDKWLPLNRDYKPLGLFAGKWAKYEDYAPFGIPNDLVTVPEIGHKEGSFCSYADPGYLYFFSDGCTPITTKDRAKYIERVRKGFLTAYRVTAVPC